MKMATGKCRNYNSENVMKQLELFPDLATAEWTAEEEEAMQQMLATQGRKYDTGKPDYTLLPWDAVEEIVKVLDFGARK